MHGAKGLIGLLISMTLIGLVCYKTFAFILKEDINSYNEMLFKITGNRRLLSVPLNLIVQIFLLATFYIMVAGFSAYFYQELNVTRIIGGVVIAVLSLLTFYKGINGIVKVNLYLIPILILLTMFLGFKNNNNLINVQITGNSARWTWIKDSILYASYNSIVLIPIIIGLKDYIKNKKENMIASTLVAFTMCVIGTVLYLILNKFKNEIGNIEIPTVFIASKIGIVYKYLYGITILIGIFTSAVSAGYSFLINCTKNKRDYKFISILICIVAIIFSDFSFSNLIDLIYPIFGYLGFIQLIFLLKY
ncbi:MAG: hypothetical protein IJN50_03820 [Clostridia bacterium]|nr:hypothetical protein [Clostridia bacterium]